MQKNIIHKCALIAAAIGLIIILVVILSGAAYPDMFFRIGAPVGLAFVFLSVILQFISWLWEIHSGIKSKQYLWTIAVVVLGLIVIVRTMLRMR